jgi:hypothetical protein
MNNEFPYGGQSKVDNFAYGYKTVREFLSENSFDFNNIFVVKGGMPQSGFFIGNPPRDMKKLFNCNGPLVVVNINKTVSPVKTPGYSWSFTGYKADMTPAGILAHEIGHFIDYSLKWISYKSEWKKIIKNEKRVSSYEPNCSEAFAEAMKLFVLNPDLLKTGRPKRYNYLKNVLKIKTVIKNPYKEVLKNSHEKLLAAAENWIK